MDGKAEKHGHRMIRSSMVEVITAKPEDLDTVVEILDEAAHWVVSRGWTGWKPGSFSPQSIYKQLERGEVYLGKIGRKIVGTITLQWSDKMFWGRTPQDAGYIHKLAVRPVYTGREVGLQLLLWAEKQAVAAGKRYLRLNCLASDRVLCDYYEKAGFKHICNVLEHRGLASLYEKTLKPLPSPDM
jgi:GNAT superfamily N-acetyltransferase